MNEATACSLMFATLFISMAIGMSVEKYAEERTNQAAIEAGLVQEVTPEGETVWIKPDKMGD